VLQRTFFDARAATGVLSCHTMKRSVTTGGIVLWGLAVIVAITSSRYFLTPPPFLRPPDSVIEMYREGPLRDISVNVAPHLYANHRALFLAHIGSGIAAMILGLFQFIAGLRKARPAIHRMLGTLYTLAVCISGTHGLALSKLIFGAGDESTHLAILPAVAKPLSCVFAHRLSRLGPRLGLTAGGRVFPD
jgi:hypothetical protein